MSGFLQKAKSSGEKVPGNNLNIIENECEDSESGSNSSSSLKTDSSLSGLEDSNIITIES